MGRRRNAKRWCWLRTVLRWLYRLCCCNGCWDLDLELASRRHTWWHCELVSLPCVLNLELLPWPQAGR